LNPGPPVPQTGALTGLRYAPFRFSGCGMLYAGRLPRARREPPRATASSGFVGGPAAHGKGRQYLAAFDPALGYPARGPTSGHRRWVPSQVRPTRSAHPSLRDHRNRQRQLALQESRLSAPKPLASLQRYLGARLLAACCARLEAHHSVLREGQNWTPILSQFWRPIDIERFPIASDHLRDHQLGGEVGAHALLHAAHRGGRERPQLRPRARPDRPAG
jgi:hypothetical protein